MLNKIKDLFWNSKKNRMNLNLVFLLLGIALAITAVR